MLLLWPILGLHYCYISFNGLCNSVEDQAPVDFIYGCPIYNWVAETWLHKNIKRHTAYSWQGTRIVVPVMAVRWHTLIWHVISDWQICYKITLSYWVCCWMYVWNEEMKINFIMCTDCVVCFFLPDKNVYTFEPCCTEFILGNLKSP